MKSNCCPIPVRSVVGRAVVVSLIEEIESW